MQIKVKIDRYILAFSVPKGKLVLTPQGTMRNEAFEIKLGLSFSVDTLIQIFLCVNIAELKCLCVHTCLSLY